MSDERDETRRFSPFDDATWADDEAGPGRGRPGDRVRRSSRTPGESSRPQPAAPPDAGGVPAPESPAEHGKSSTAGDAEAPTVVDGPRAPRPPDATSVMPAAEDSPAWSGRAEVRAPQPARTVYQREVDWPSGADPRQRDRWWMPIVVGIVVLVLLAALGWGIYLIVQNAAKNNNAPGPAVTTSAPPAPSTVPTTPTTEPSSAPTSTTPSPTASTTEPTDDAVAIPALRGLTVAEAKSALHGDGVDSTRVIYRPSIDPPGTVIDSDPREGQEVPPDSTVTLVVAASATATTPAATPTR